MKHDEMRLYPTPLSLCRTHGPITYPPLTGVKPAWFALYVQVNHEKEVEKRLKEKSVDCFLPLTQRWSKQKDRRKKLYVPLFPGYLFVNTVLDNYMHVEVLKIRGTISIIKNSEGPLPVPDDEMDNLKKVLHQAKNVALHPYLEQGTQVRVIRGPFSGCRGILVRLDQRKGKLVVSMGLIRQAVSIELDIEDVQPAAEPAIIA